jgi:hypothetical protein
MPFNDFSFKASRVLNEIKNKITEIIKISRINLTLCAKLFTANNSDTLNVVNNQNFQKSIEIREKRNVKRFSSFVTINRIV